QSLDVTSSESTLQEESLSNFGAATYRADDLIPEESETVLLALKRLPPKEAYDRVFRMRRAFQCSLAHQLLPKSEQTKPEDDVPYLTPLIREIEAETKEREDLEAMVVARRK
ncbi:Cytochrome b-c1 complex subunit 7, mitochondrial, partial [Cryomyces antarcticus]